VCAAVAPILPMLLSKNLKERAFTWEVAAAALVASPLTLAFWFASR